MRHHDSVSTIVHDVVEYIVSFFFNHTATPEIYTLSLHDALPISHHLPVQGLGRRVSWVEHGRRAPRGEGPVPEGAELRGDRSEEHTSELQSLAYLVCRLLLEKKNNQQLPQGLNAMHDDHATNPHP